MGREIPLALIVTLMLSMSTGIWYASATTARIDVIERTLQTQTSLREDIVQIREQLRSLDRLTQRLETYLDRRAEAERGKSDRARGSQ